jgi:hypothetical protein
MENNFFTFCKSCKKYSENKNFVRINTDRLYKTCVSCRFKRRSEYMDIKRRQREDKLEQGCKILESYGLDPNKYSFIIHFLK